MAERKNDWLPYLLHGAAHPTHALMDCPGTARWAEVAAGLRVDGPLAAIIEAVGTAEQLETVESLQSALHSIGEALRGGEMVEIELPQEPEPDRKEAEDGTSDSAGDGAEDAPRTRRGGRRST